MPAPGRVAVVGLDAAEWTLVERLMAAGDMPHLEALRRRSAVALLDNPDYRTGLVWEHFLTGRGAKGCGRQAAIEFDPATYDAWKDEARPHTPFYATDPPVSTIILDVPYVSLLTEVPGVQVTSWGGHDPAYPRASRPAGLLREIETTFGPHPAFANDYEIVWHRPHAIDALADALVVGTGRRADIARWLQARHPGWELLVTVFSEPHSANEAFWHGIDDASPVASAGTVEQARRRLRDVYRAVDEALGRILADLPNDSATVVFAMHGGGRNDADIASMVLLPELLYRLHAGRPFLRDPDQELWAAAGRPIVVPDPATTWDSYMDAVLPNGDVGDTYEEPPAAGHDAHRRVGPFGVPIPEETSATPLEIGVPWAAVDWEVPMRYRAEWPAMRAFALPTFYEGRVRINLQGRERNGIVPLADYERACDEVEEVVAACRDPRTGRPVLAEAFRPRAGDPLDLEGPDADVQLLWSDASDAWAHPVAGTIGPFPYRRTGGHSRRGFAFVAGPGITPGEIGQRPALDVTPTIVELLGRPVVEGRFEGRSLVTFSAV